MQFVRIRKFVGSLQSSRDGSKARSSLVGVVNSCQKLILYIEGNCSRVRLCLLSSRGYFAFNSPAQGPSN
jgi:hypothetical protein